MTDFRSSDSSSGSLSGAPSDTSPESADDADFKSNFSDSGFWSKLGRYAVSAGGDVVEKSLLLYYVLQRPNVPVWAKTAIYGALGYFITLTDAIPDITPAVGYADDLGVLTMALVTVAAYIDDEVREKARSARNKWFPRGESAPSGESAPGGKGRGSDLD